MSQGSSSSFSKDSIGATRLLSSPVGQNLANATTRTLVPSMGAVAYDSGANLLYYGSVDTWNVAGQTGISATGSTGSGGTGQTGLGGTGRTGMTGLGATGNTGQTGLGATGNTGQTGLGATGRTGMTGLGSTGNTGQPGITSVGPFSSASDANGATIASQVLTLYSADLTNPGGVNVTGQSFTGVKTFVNGITVQTPVTPGMDNILTRFCRGGVNPGTWSGGFSAVSPHVAVTLVDFIATIMTGTPFAASGSNSIATLSPAFEPELWPSTPNRGGIIPVLDSGVYKIGYFKVSTTGIVTVGIGLNSAGNLIPFTGGVGATGIPDCAVSYTTF